MLNSFREKGIITSDVVYNAMLRVDRKNFVTEDLYHQAYVDHPRPIEFNTTISAPSMHAMTLEKLKDHLAGAKKVLDIGTGSGYMAACFAEMAPDGCVVYFLDHIS